MYTLPVLKKSNKYISFLFFKSNEMKWKMKGPGDESKKQSGKSESIHKQTIVDFGLLVGFVDSNKNIN